MKRVLFILSTLEDEDVEWLAAAGEKRLIAEGRSLITVNVPIDALFIVLDGALSVRLGRNEEEIGQVTAGEVLGEVSLLDSRPPVASVVALEDSFVLAIPHAALKHKLDVEERFAARFYRALGRFLAHRQRAQLVRLGYAGEDTLDENLDEESLDPELLDELSLVGRRFGTLLRRMGVEPSRDL